MFKSILILSATLCASIVSATYYVYVANDAGTSNDLYVSGAGERLCFCLSKTQTATITGDNGGEIRAFSTADCTGNFDTIGANSKMSNAQWVNSVSFGASGVASAGPDGFCPNFITYDGVVPYQ